MHARFLLGLAACAFLLAPLHLSAQAAPTGRRGGIIQAGVAASNGTSDEFSQRVTGFTAYGTFDFNQHLGVEADAHLMAIITPHDLIEDTYLLGPRYVYRIRRFEPYAKGLIGIGSTSVDTQLSFPGTPGTYFVIGVGGGLDIRLGHRINVRAIDYEEQFWSSYPPDGLTPTVLSFGIAYRIR